MYVLGDSTFLFLKFCSPVTRQLGCFMFRKVSINENINSGVIRISSRPEGYAILLFMAALIGVCALPLSKYRDDYFAYVGLLYLLGLVAYYFIISIQSVTFVKKDTIVVRKGFRSWQFPFEAVSGGYTSYEKRVSRQSLQATHFFNFELQVDLPENSKQWIRNGKANVFHYGFSQWGSKQQELWNKCNDILNDKGIPNLSSK